MTSDPDFRRVKELVLGARHLDAAARAEYLARECSRDPALRREVESLIDQDAATVDAVEQVATASVVEALSSPMDLPEQVPGYHVLGLIASGGMGSVYRAEQVQPQRIVALKVIRPLATSPDALRRFRQEIEILGKLHHPGIAQVHDAGTLELECGSIPYLAMGVSSSAIRSSTTPNGAGSGFASVLPLSPPCAMPSTMPTAREWSTEISSLRTFSFRRVVSPRSSTSVVARVMDSSLRVTMVHTRGGQAIGTLPYMSPEQLKGDSAVVDRRADVYALGVLTYELLGHRLPLNVDDVSMPEAARMIAEEEPPGLASLRSELGGDIDTMVAQALAKEPERRYQSAAELADDLRLYLADRPIRARPPSTLYLLRKFTRRHRGVVLAVVALIAVLIAGSRLGSDPGLARSSGSRRGRDTVLRRDHPVRLPRARGEQLPGSAAPAGSHW